MSYIRTGPAAFLASSRLLLPLPLLLLRWEGVRHMVPSIDDLTR